MPKRVRTVIVTVKGIDIPRMLVVRSTKHKVLDCVLWISKMI